MRHHQPLRSATGLTYDDEIVGGGNIPIAARRGAWFRVAFIIPPPNCGAALTESLPRVQVQLSFHNRLLHTHGGLFVIRLARIGIEFTLRQ